MEFTKVTLVLLILYFKDINARCCPNPLPCAGCPNPCGVKLDCGPVDSAVPCFSECSKPCPKPDSCSELLKTVPCLYFPEVEYPLTAIDSMKSFHFPSCGFTPKFGCSY